MAKQQQTITVPLAFPVKGKDDNWARQNQPPLTTADCLNVWPYDRLQRARGARRPGLRRLFADPVGGGVALYRQARRCSDGELASVYVAVSEIGVYPFYFKWLGDNGCYQVLETEPAIPNPQFPVATQRAEIDDCDDADCDDSPPNNPPKYRLSRLCSNPGQFAPLWFNDEWAGGVYPFYYRFDGDGRCYKVLGTDPLLPAAGPTPVNRTPVVDCSDPLCACVSGSCGTYTAQVGPLVEHNRGGSLNWINRSAPGVVCTTGVATKIVFAAASEGLVVLVPESLSGSITQSYSGVAGDPVTITIPAAAIIFRDTTGFMLHQSEALGPATVAKTLTDGTLTYTWPAGTAGNHGTGHVVDCAAGGFATRPWSTGVTIAELASLGWIDPDGNFRFRLALVPSGAGSLQVNSVACTEPLYRQARNCSDNALADVWLLSSTVTTLPFTFVLTAPPAGSAVSGAYYVSGADAPSDTPGTIVSAYTVVTDCNTGTADPANQYRIVRRCSDGVATGGIVKADTIPAGLPVTFRPGGGSVCVQVLPTDAPVLSTGQPIITFANATTDCTDPACAVSDTPCAQCSDSTPGRLNIIFFGVTLCTSCVNEASTGFAMNPLKVIGSLTNYCPEQNAFDACQWTGGSAPLDIKVRVWQAPTFDDCDDDNPHEDYLYSLVVTRSGTTWRVLVTAFGAGGLPDLFDGEADAALCATGVTINNSISTANNCNVEPVPKFGGGGECSLVLSTC